MGGILCQSQIADYIANLMYIPSSNILERLPAAASNAYFFASSAGPNAKMHRLVPVPLLLLLLLACLLDILSSPGVSAEL
jgi:hypothetical protein